MTALFLCKQATPPKNTRKMQTPRVKMQAPRLALLLDKT